MAEKYCGACRHWVKREMNIGDCRKQPPTFVREQGPWAMRVWPNTYDIDFCDSFKPLKDADPDAADYP